MTLFDYKRCPVADRCVQAACEAGLPSKIPTVEDITFFDSLDAPVREVLAKGYIQAVSINLTYHGVSNFHSAFRHYMRNAMLECNLLPNVVEQQISVQDILAAKPVNTRNSLVYALEDILQLDLGGEWDPEGVGPDYFAGTPRCEIRWAYSEQSDKYAASIGSIWFDEAPVAVWIDFGQDKWSADPEVKLLDKEAAQRMLLLLQSMEGFRPKSQWDRYDEATAEDEYSFPDGRLHTGLLDLENE